MHADVKAADDRQLKEILDGCLNRIKSIRAQRRRVKYSTIKEKAHAETKQALDQLTAKSNRRIVALDRLGSKVGASILRTYGKDKGISVTVGYMWLHKVYPIYKVLYNTPREYFILSADELSVNHQYIKLFIGQAWNFKENKIEQVYIGQSKVGDELAFVRTSAKEAITAAIKAYDNWFAGKVIKGEAA